MGIGARWNTANVEPLRQMAWHRRGIESVSEQWQWSREQAGVLEGCFTPRHVANAWNQVVLQGKHPRESMKESVLDINCETRKEQEG